MAAEIAYLGIGGNLGDRQAYLQAALESLRRHEGVLTLRQSSLYKTAPRDVLNQPWFLNLVVAIETELSPPHLLQLAQLIESEIGRVRDKAAPRGPRVIDVDVLLYGQLQLLSDELTIPHPRMLQRRFVLEPLLEIAPDLLYPGTQRQISEWLPSVQDQMVRKNDS